MREELQIPSSTFQRNIKSQTSTTFQRALVVLELGAWSFLGIWILGFEVFGSAQDMPLEHVIDIRCLDQGIGEQAGLLRNQHRIIGLVSRPTAM